MPNLIPEKIINFNVYSDGGRLLGLADGNFPSLEFMTTEIKGAGIAGTIDSPGLGQLGSLTVTLNWRMTTPDFWTLGEPGGHELDMYAAGLEVDTGSGDYETSSIHMYLKAFTKKLDAGKLSVMESQEASTEHEIYYLKAEVNGAEVLEVDKYNFIYKVNGEDYLEDVRAALGMR